jgi:surface polysaccharide O-acyltransferase-like enzyme
MKQRIFYLDWLRVAATIMVVTIHVSAWDIGNMHHGPLSKWLAANLYESISRASVPLFVMISGALMLGPHHEIGYKAFLQKRLTKVLIPLAGWSFIYYLYLIHRGDYAAFSIKHFIRLAMTNGISTHFWFMYMILGLYLISPLVNILIKNAAKKDIQYFLLLWLFASVIIKFMKYLLGFGPNIELYFVTDYVGYFVLGYYLSIS